MARALASAPRAQPVEDFTLTEINRKVQQHRAVDRRPVHARLPIVGDPTATRFDSEHPQANLAVEWPKNQGSGFGQGAQDSQRNAKESKGGGGVRHPRRGVA